MIDYIGNGIKNNGNGNLRMVSLLNAPALTLFDINNYDVNERAKKECIEIHEPAALTMHANIIKSDGFIFVKNELEVHQNITDHFSCIGDYYLLTLLQKGNAHIEDPKSKHNKKSKHPIEQHYIYFKADINDQNAINMAKGEKIQYIVLLLDKNFVNSLLRDNYKDLLTSELFIPKKQDGLPSPINTCIPIALNLYEAMKSLFELSCEEQIYLPFTKLKIIEIFLLLDLNCNKEPDDACIKQCNIDHFKNIKAWIVINHSKGFTLKSLSRKFGVNELVLKTNFKDLFGQTIRQFVIELRMQEAKNLIIQNEESVNEIAFKVGYKSVSHFIQTFKKYYGITPNQHKTLNDVKSTNTVVSTK